MDAVNNPYTPNAGAQPEILIGRDEQVIEGMNGASARMHSRLAGNLGAGH